MEVFRKKILIIFLLISIFYTNIFVFASDMDEDRIVKVGFYDFDGFNNLDASGNRSGYGYEYLEHISMFSGWKYHFTEDINNIEEALIKLEQGDIDIFYPVKRSDDISSRFLISKYAIGEEKYILTVNENNKKYYEGDIIHLDNMRIAVQKYDNNIGLYEDFAEKNNLNYNFIYMNSMQECVEAMTNESVDGILGSNFRDLRGQKEILTLASSKIYIALNKENQDLYDELNNYMYELNEHEPDLDDELYFKYFIKKYPRFPNFNREEVNFILNNSNVRFRIGCDSSRLPFSWDDDGDVKGFYIDAIEKLANVSELKFDIIPIDLRKELKEYDCNQIFSRYDLDACIGFEYDMNLANLNDLKLSNPIISYNIAEIICLDTEISKIGMIRGDEKIYDYIMMQNFHIESFCYSDNFEGLSETLEYNGIIEYEDIEECIYGLKNKEVHAVYIDEFSGRIIKNRLDDMESNFIIEKSANINECIAFEKDEEELLISIINKSIFPWVQHEVINSSNRYIMELKKDVDFEDYWQDNYLEIIFAVVLIGMMIAVIMYSNKKHFYELEKMNQKLIIANNAKSDFLANMSHELRTPLNAIIGLNTLLQDSLDNKEEAEEYVRKIETSSKMLLNIINDILDMSAIESGKMKLFCENFNIKEQIFAITTIYYLQCKKKNVKFEVETNNIIEEILYGDSYRLRQVILNLISNAYKFTEPSESIHVSFSQKIIDEKNVQLRIHVKDTGCGMTEELLGRLFDKFEQEDASTVRTHGGSGLGLAITKSIVDMMNGSIDVFSKKGEGSDFIVTIPMKIGNGKRKSRDSKMPEEFEKMNTLIVDDNLDTCNYIKSIVKKWDMKCTSFTSSLDALNSVKKNLGTEDEYNLFIIDIRMPELNGIELSKELRKIVKSEDIILLISGYDISEYREMVDAIGVNKFLQKPIFKSELYNSIVEAIDDRVEFKSVDINHEDEIDLTGLYVLLVEDNEINRIIAKKLLTRVGVEVIEAENGKEAIDRVINENYTFDIILMDIQMPVLNGYDATKKIRSLNTEYTKNLLIYAMTANTFQRDIDKCIEAGMNGHIGKPIEIYRLYSILKEVKENKFK